MTAEFFGRPRERRETPLGRFLAECHASFAPDHAGSAADYIPELAKADPSHLGISLATLDGHIYTAGDHEAPFTIQSISKPFVYALALEQLGPDGVGAKIGVEPSGNAFNSIRLLPDNRPYNAMVNAGAIACTGLVLRAAEARGFDLIHDTLNRLAGRTLAIDEAVFQSEKATGDRNRAIAYLLRNHGILSGDVDDVIDAYFRQCSVLVTARDLAVMGATLANRGTNPLSGQRVVSPINVARTLAVMTSSGMYDYAGQWGYSVGLPSKSGVGGGIVAALPAQFGLGTYSPLLDRQGNSVRGIKVCEAISHQFGLHVLNRTGDTHSVIISDYGLEGIASRRNRQAQDRAVLDANANLVHILELAGTLNFAQADHVARRVLGLTPRVEFLIFDFARVPSMSDAAIRMLKELFETLAGLDIRILLSGARRRPEIPAALADLPAGGSRKMVFSLLDEAIEWAEDQIIFQRGGFSHLRTSVDLTVQKLLAGLTDAEIAAIREAGEQRRYEPGTRIITSGESAASLFFLSSGMVSAQLGNGTRIATMMPGTTFGEMALIGGARMSDVVADSHVTCIELPIERFHALGGRFPGIGERVMRNLAELFSRRLSEANARVEVLAGG